MKILLLVLILAGCGQDLMLPTPAVERETNKKIVKSLNK